MNTIIFPGSYGLYNESQFLRQIALLAPKSWDLYLVVPILLREYLRRKKMVVII
jgi:hypothetical protein